MEEVKCSGSRIGGKVGTVGGGGLIGFGVARKDTRGWWGTSGVFDVELADGFFAFGCWVRFFGGFEF